MFTHIMVGASDLEKSKQFYNAVLGTLGVKGPFPDKPLKWVPGTPIPMVRPENRLVENRRSGPSHVERFRNEVGFLPIRRGV